MSEPTDPILNDGVEKLELDDGTVVLLDQCRIVHIVNDRCIKGFVVDPVTAFTTRETRLIDMRRVQRHVSMGFRNSDRSLHEMPEVTPRSLQR